MDMYCMKCGEPYEIECITEPEEYNMVLNANKSIVSCDACAWHAKRGFKCEKYAEAARIANDVSGGDLDGMVSLMNEIVEQGDMSWEE